MYLHCSNTLICIVLGQVDVSINILLYTPFAGETILHDSNVKRIVGECSDTMFNWSKRLVNEWITWYLNNIAKYSSVVTSCIQGT